MTDMARGKNNRIQQQSKSFFARLASQWQLALMSVPIFLYVILFNYVPMWGWTNAFKDYGNRKLVARGITLDAIYFSADVSDLGLTPGCRVDVAFYPQINEFRGRRDLQLQVIDLHRAPSRAQMERAISERFRRGEVLTAEEARFLLPSRSEFADLWRWLERQSTAGTVVEDTLLRISRSVSRSAGQREIPARTQLCLEVFEERGLIDLTEHTGRLRITLHRLEHKVDLESSHIMLTLRRQAEDDG